MITQWEVTEMFDPEDTLTHEQILFRFKKLFNRDMTRMKCAFSSFGNRGLLDKASRPRLKNE
jgi:hypothetical protein